MPETRDREAHERSSEIRRGDGEGEANAVEDESDRYQLRATETVSYDGDSDRGQDGCEPDGRDEQAEARIIYAVDAFRQAFRELLDTHAKAGCDADRHKRDAKGWALPGDACGCADLSENVGLAGTGDASRADQEQGDRERRVRKGIHEEGGWRAPAREHEASNGWSDGTRQIELDGVQFVGRAQLPFGNDLRDKRLIGGKVDRRSESDRCGEREQDLDGEARLVAHVVEREDQGCLRNKRA